MSAFKEFLREAGGSTVTIFAMSLPVLLAGAGAATMYSFELMTRTQMQAAVDSGALAGTALGADATDDARIKAAKVAYAGNFGGGGLAKSDNSDYWVKSGGAPNFTVSNLEVTGEAHSLIRNPFSFIIGEAWLPVTTTAVGAKILSDPVCILGLDPTQKATVDMSGQPVITAKDCDIQANSSNGSGMRQKGSPTVKAKKIGTSGGYTGSGYDPLPIKGTVPITDPYKDVPFPPSNNCDYNNVTISGATVTLDPGVYCGGIRIKAGANVTLKPGIYIMKDDALWMNSNSSLQGQEVMIGFTGPNATLYMEGSSSLDLTSPASGTYMNMQFMQQPNTGGDNLYFSVIGNNTFKYDGVLYAPTFDVWFGGGTNVTASSPTYAMVADKIWIQDQSVINVTYENKRNLPMQTAGHFRYGARLIK